MNNNIILYTSVKIYARFPLCDKNTPQEKKTLGNIRRQKHQIRGWRATSAAGLQGQDSH